MSKERDGEPAVVCGHCGVKLTYLQLTIDTNEEAGVGLILEAQNYAKAAMARRNFPQIPQFWESAPGLGGNLTLKGPIQNDTTPSDIVLVLDRSGSMASKDFASESNQDTRLQIVNKGAGYFVAALDPTAPNQVGIVSYNQAASSLLSLTDPVTNNSAITSALAGDVTGGPSGTSRTEKRGQARAEHLWSSHRRCSPQSVRVAPLWPFAGWLCTSSRPMTPAGLGAQRCSQLVAE